MTKKLIKIRPDRLNKIRLELIEDFLDLGLIGNGIMLAGGFGRSLVDLGVCKIDDFDVFFQDLRLVPWARAHLIGKGAKLIFACKEGKLYTFELNGQKIQLICERAFKDVPALLDSFDFHVCMTGFDGIHFYIHYETVRDVRKKRVSINKITYPLASVKRLIKYSNKGYNVNLALEQFIKDIVEKTTNGFVFDDESMRKYID